MSGARNEDASAGVATDPSPSGTVNRPSGNGETPPGEELVVLVDASNVAHGKTSVAIPPTIDNLRHVLDRLRAYPIRVVALADASLRHKIDRKVELERMFSAGEIEQVPAGTVADDFLWQLWKSYTAQGTRAYIVTNDKFPLTYAKAESREENPRIAFLFLGTELMFQPPIESLLSARSASMAAKKPIEPPVSAVRPEAVTASTGASASGGTGGVVRGPSTGPTPLATQPAGETRPVSHVQLIEGATEVIAALTQPPGEIFRRVNFATVCHDLHEKSEGDFVAKFGLSRPKDLAMELEELGLVKISYTNTTMYVEPTTALEERIKDRGLPRRELEPPGEATREAGGESAPSAAVATLEEGDVRGLPEVIEVSSRSVGPTVEIPRLELFLKVVRDNRPKHVFHWWSKVKSDLLWKREGEFFFVLEGTTYRLSGKGYRTLADFMDGRARGMQGADDPKVIGDPNRYDQPPYIWRGIHEFHNLDEREDRPSEGDVYYFVREKGFSDFSTFLTSEAAKGDPPIYR